MHLTGVGRICLTCQTPTSTRSHAISGTLFLIGGSEDKEPGGKRRILRAVAERAGGGPLVVCTPATKVPEVVGPQYAERFRDLGVADVRHVDLRSALDSIQPENIAAFEGARVVFFSGGDQRRITACLLNTPLHGALRDLLRRGGTLAGTSAGAMAVSSTMIAGGPGTGLHGKAKLELAPGLGLLDGAIVDSHFAQRGRWARLLASVARSPGHLGIGVDEDTAAVVEGGRLRVLGSGHVWLLDGAELRGVREDAEQLLGLGSAWNARTAMLGVGDELELASGGLRRDQVADAVGE